MKVEYLVTLILSTAVSAYPIAYNREGQLQILNAQPPVLEAIFFTTETGIRKYSTGQKKVKVPNGRCGGGAVAVRYLYARGMLEVRSRYAGSTLKVRSRYTRSTVGVRFKYGVGTVPLRFGTLTFF